MSRFYKEKSLRRNDFFVRNCGRNINCRPCSKMASKSVTNIKRQSGLNKRAVIPWARVPSLLTVAFSWQLRFDGEKVVAFLSLSIYNLIKGDLLDHWRFTIRPESKRKISWRDSHVVLFIDGCNLVPDYGDALHLLASCPTLGNYLDHQLYCMA